jgi:biotin carboxyl carrier protein
MELDTQQDEAAPEMELDTQQDEAEPGHSLHSQSSDSAPGASPPPFEPTVSYPEEPEPKPLEELEITSPTERMESAILEEEEHPESSQIAAAAHRTETLLDTPIPGELGEIEYPKGVRLGPDVSIVSVGEAVHAGDRSVRVPLVLGDAEGQTTTLVLTIQLDPLSDETPS